MTELEKLQQKLARKKETITRIAGRKARVEAEIIAIQAEIDALPGAE